MGLKMYKLRVIMARVQYLKKFKVWVLGVLENETCYKTGRVSTCDLTVIRIHIGKNYWDSETCRKT